MCKDIINTELLHHYSFLHSFSLEESLKVVREYLIAATAKDCSLMLSFRPTDLEARTAENSSIFLESCNQSFEFKVCMICLLVFNPCALAFSRRVITAFPFVFSKHYESFYNAG